MITVRDIALKIKTRTSTMITSITTIPPSIVFLMGFVMLVMIIVVMLVVVVMTLLGTTVSIFDQKRFLPPLAWSTVKLFDNLFALIFRFHPDRLRVEAKGIS